VVEVVSPAPFARIGIVGVGLIGGSVALAVRHKLPAATIVGLDRGDRKDLQQVVDQIVERVQDLADADLIVVCVPLTEMARTLEEIARTNTRAIVTDVSSTKRGTMAAAAASGLRSFVGGHPMAGSERPGLDAARRDLFEGRPWLLVRGPADDAASARVEAFVESLGARPRWMDAEEHDRTVAYISHLPQIIAAALMNTAEIGAPLAGPETAGNAFGEMTRLASSPSAMWQRVLAENGDFVAEALDVFRQQLPLAPDTFGDWAAEALGRSGAARSRWQRARRDA
jgi:prephenate dehydrogenase